MSRRAHNSTDFVHLFSVASLDMAPTPNGGKGYLTQLAANADSFQPDHIPDSCDEDSSDDDEVPMRARTPPSRSHGQPGMGKENLHSTSMTPSTSARAAPKALAAARRNGNLAQPAVRDMSEAEHYVVQWCVLPFGIERQR